MFCLSKVAAALPPRFGEAQANAGSATLNAVSYTSGTTTKILSLKIRMLIPGTICFEKSSGIIIPCSYEYCLYRAMETSMA